MGLFAALIPFIPHVVHGVEALFGKGNGKLKKEAALGLMGDAVNIMSAAKFGSAIGGANSAVMEYISDLIEATVKYYNATGQLPKGELKP